MKNIRFFLLLMIFASGCSVQKVSKITSENIRLGMTVAQVTAAIGMPYKTALPNENVELFYYKEQIWIAKSHRLVETILMFKDGILQSVTQGEEKSADSHSVITE
ncbi:MAG: hypothetical protein Q4G08_11865 [Capnocytophaga sp.]|nr:hypothetical protein [Capnocytophaga sp.]